MSTLKSTTGTKGLREWWASPPRSGIRRTIAPWEYRHLRASGITRLAAGFLLVVGGVMFASYGADALAAIFLVVGALNLGGGYWYLTMAPSTSAHT